MLHGNMTFLYIVYMEDNITHVTCYNIIRHTGGWNMLQELFKLFKRDKKEVMMLSCMVANGVIIPLSVAIR